MADSYHGGSCFASLAEMSALCYRAAMKVLWIFLGSALVLACAWTAPAAGNDEHRPTGQPATAADVPSKVLVEFFFVPGCEECREVEENILPPFLELLGEDIVLGRYDISNSTNYLRLAWLQEKLRVATSERVSVYVDETVHLGGLPEIKAELIPMVEAAVLARTAPAETPSSGRKASRALSATGEATDHVLKKRLATWTVATIAAAGLLDGLNPCAFATLIFFMTLLTVAGKRGVELIAVGLGFCSAVFLTYFLLGFGIFHLIQTLEGYALAGAVLRWLTMACLLILAWLSFKDAWAFGRTGQPRLIKLQLPLSIRNQIHRIMRSGLTTRWLFPGSFAVGFLVTLLESVCTGQVYVPTLVYLSSRVAGPEALGLLTLYNAMMVTPQVVVFWATYCGVTNQHLLAWSRANALLSKILLGLLFAALAVLLLWL